MKIMVNIEIRCVDHQNRTDGCARCAELATAERELIGARSRRDAVLFRLGHMLTNRELIITEVR